MDQYAVFGNPIAQSKSPSIHSAFAEQTGQHLKYSAILAPKEGFKVALAEFFNNNSAKGCNVTMPFKEEAAQWVDELTDAARLAGAVNTIIRNADDKFVGDNTDGFGLVNDVLRNHIVLKDKRVLLLGAGGAARGVILPLLAQYPSEIIIANRTIEKADTLVELFADKRLASKAFTNLTQGYDVIINATSTSINGELPSIANEVYSGVAAVYDMVYQSKPTVFMQHAAAQGVANCVDGLGMLVGQAAQSFQRWTGEMPDVEPVLLELRKAL